MNDLGAVAPGDLFERLRRSSSRTLPPFLKEQRWFASKARTIDTAELIDGVWLDAHIVLAFARVTFAEGDSELYSLLLKVASDLQGVRPIGSIEEADGALQFGESSSESAAAKALIRALCQGKKLPSVGGGVLQSGDRETQRIESTELSEKEVRTLSAEQSNTSIRVGDDFVFKLFRKVQHGENPELEVSRFLWRSTPFRAMPGLRGWQTMRFASGDEATVGILQDWVTNQGDGWTYVLSLLPVRSEEQGLVLAQDLNRLGQITADFHRALAGAEMEPGFVPEVATEGDIARWVSAHQRRAQEVFRQLDSRKKDISASVGKDAWIAVEEGRDRLIEGAQLSLSEGDAFQKVRVHGDFHLGQTLKTEGGFVLFDFEGEPGRSLEERRAKSCALKDVAGMLRSLDYAVQQSYRSNPSVRDADAVDLGQRLRTTFLSGYFSSTFERGVSFLPRSRLGVQAWLDFFEREKLIYELGYELNNRPDWIWIPLQGAARLLQRSG